MLSEIKILKASSEQARAIVKIGSYKSFEKFRIIFLNLRQRIKSRFNFRFLASKGADLNAFSLKTTPPIYIASENGHDDVVYFLLKRGAKADQKKIGSGASALHVAAFKGYFRIVQQLVEKNANVNHVANGVTPLFLAVLKNDTEMSRLLVSNGADIRVAKAMTLYSEINDTGSARAGRTGIDPSHAGHGPSSSATIQSMVGTLESHNTLELHPAASAS